MTERVEILAHITPAAASRRLTFTASSGAYIGSITFDSVNSAALGAMGEAFQEFCAREASRISPASAAALSGFPRS